MKSYTVKIQKWSYHPKRHLNTKTLNFYDRTLEGALNQVPEGWEIYAFWENFDEEYENSAR